MKGSVCFVLIFALPQFSPPLPSGVQISKQNMHKTFHTRIFFTGVVIHGCSEFSLFFEQFLKQVRNKHEYQAINSGL